MCRDEAVTVGDLFEEQLKRCRSEGPCWGDRECKFWQTSGGEAGNEDVFQYPIPSMYGIFTYIWLFFMVNVGKYTIHGAYGYAFVEMFGSFLGNKKGIWQFLCWGDVMRDFCVCHRIYNFPSIFVTSIWGSLPQHDSCCSPFSLNPETLNVWRQWRN